MRGFGILTSLLGRTPAPRLRAPGEDEMTSILDVVTHMPEEAFRSICTGQMSEIAEAAALSGTPIGQIGAATRDVEIDGTTFSARCQVRFGREPTIHDALISGTIDHRAMVRAQDVTLLGSRAFARTA